MCFTFPDFLIYQGFKIVATLKSYPGDLFFEENKPAKQPQQHIESFGVFQNLQGFPVISIKPKIIQTEDMFFPESDRFDLLALYERIYYYGALGLYSF